MFSETLIRTPEDIESYFAARSSSAAACEITPLSTTNVYCENRTVSLAGSRIEHARWNGIRVNGVVSRDAFTFALFLQSSENNSVWSSSIRTGDLAWSPAGASRCANYPEPAGIFAISLPEETVRARCEMRGLPLGEHQFVDHGKIQAPEDSVKNLKACFRMFFGVAAVSGRNVVSSEKMLQRASGAVLDATIDTVAASLSVTDCDSSHYGSYEAIMRRAEDLMRSDENTIFNVNELAARLGVSRKTLHRAFDEVVSISPTTYIRNWRLSRARADLCSGRFETVADCASAWGFWDFGRFAGYYKNLFGELPSSTILSH